MTGAQVLQAIQQALEEMLQCVAIAREVLAIAEPAEDDEVEQARAEAMREMAERWSDYSRDFRPASHPIKPAMRPLPSP